MSPKFPNTQSSLDRFKSAQTLKAEGKTPTGASMPSDRVLPNTSVVNRSFGLSKRTPKVIKLGDLKRSSQPDVAQPSNSPASKAPPPPPPSRSFLADDLLTPVEAAGVLRLSEKTLANWRSQTGGNGLTYRKVGGRIRYVYRDLIHFIALSKSVSDAASKGGEGA